MGTFLDNWTITIGVFKYRIVGLVKESLEWYKRYNAELHDLYDDLIKLTIVKLRKLQRNEQVDGIDACEIFSCVSKAVVQEKWSTRRPKSTLQIKPWLPK